MALLENPFAMPSLGQNSQGRTAPVQGNQPASGNDPTQTGGTGKSQVVPGDGEDTTGGSNEEDTINAGTGHDELLQFDKLWQDAPVDPKAPKLSEDTGYLPAVDSTKLQQYIDTLDFTKNITPEELTAISSGGEAATKALLGVINKTSRQSVLLGFNASRKLVETGIGNAKTKFSADIPTHVKDIMVQNGLTSSNPLMEDNRFSPVIDAVRKRYQDRFPRATPTQIEQAVNQYFDAIVEQGTKNKNKGKQITDPNATALDGMQKRAVGDPNADFEKWFDS